jgi:ATP-dependent Zn protease
MMKRTPKQLRATAYHEAGHAVISRVLMLASGRASIEPDYDEGSAGHAITELQYACLDEWEKRGKVRAEAAVWHARIMVLMAGAEAEIEILGTKALGDGDDRLKIAFTAEEMPRGEAFWEGLEPRLRAMTRMLVRRHRAIIERVANALRDKTTLSGEAIDKLVGRSVDDVKVNAPYLLAMHRLSETAQT